MSDRVFPLTTPQTSTFQYASPRTISQALEDVESDPDVIAQALAGAGETPVGVASSQTAGTPASSTSSASEGAWVRVWFLLLLLVEPTRGFRTTTTTSSIHTSWSHNNPSSTQTKADHPCWMTHYSHEATSETTAHHLAGTVSHPVRQPTQ